MKVSPSQLKTWQKCSLQAKYTYVDGIRDEAVGSSAHFGTSVHAGLEALNRGASVEQAIQVFKDVWDSTPIDYWNRRTSETRFKDEGPRLIREYYENFKWTTHKVLGAEQRFMVPFGEHSISGIIDLLYTNKKEDELFIVDYKTGKRPILDELALDVQFCADAETEILTRRGWKKYDELIDGEDVMTLNFGHRLAEWQPMLSLNVFPVDKQELISLEGRSHSSLTTKNHRWYVRHTVSSKKGWYNEDRVVESSQLTGDDAILCAAPVANLPLQPMYEDSFVELVSWFWTEGNTLPRKSGNLGIQLSQSEVINPQYVAQIREALKKTYGDPVEDLHTVRHLATPAYRETYSEDSIRWYLNPTASSSILECMEDIKLKKVSPEFIQRLTQEQLNLFIDVSMQADGSINESSKIITQSEKGRLDSFQMACALAGIRTSLRPAEVKGSGPYQGRAFWRMTLKEKEPWFKPSKPTRSTQTYTGVVWCPTTPNQTWLARRNGHVYYTGNTSYDWAVSQKEFWVGVESDDPNLPEKYAGVPNGEELFEKFRDVKRTLVWYDIRKGQEFKLAPRTDFDYARLYRLIEQVDRAIEKEVFVPTISDESCGWCPHKDRCPVYF